VKIPAVKEIKQFGKYKKPGAEMTYNAAENLLLKSWL
jgi:hypothetical protein